MEYAKLAKQAFEACCSSQTTVRHGEKRGFPFWNVESQQFMYVPAFHFTADQLTRVQHENGQIPTHWMNTGDTEKNFWFNCMFCSCETPEAMAPYKSIILE